METVIVSVGYSYYERSPALSVDNVCLNSELFIGDIYTSIPLEIVYVWEIT